MPTPTRTRALLGALLLGGGLLVLPGVASAADTRTCGDFDGDQAAAQRAFEADRTGLAALDRDGDGTACESLLSSSQGLADRIAALQCGSDYTDQVQALRNDLADLAITDDGEGVGDDVSGDGSDGADGGDSGVTDDDSTADDANGADAKADAANADAANGDAANGDDTTTISAADLTTLLDAQTATLNNCIATTDDVDPTASDGSVPITDGGQVSVVPEGSAATGEA